MRSLKKQTWAVIRFRENDSPALVTFDEGERDGKFHWWGGFPWAVMLDESVILHTYGTFVEGDDRIDGIELDFYKTFCSADAQDPVHSACWISPKGAFFPCDYGDHDGVARILAAQHHSSLKGVRELEKQGWLRVTDDGHILGDVLDEITQAQLDTLYDLLHLPTTNIDYVTNLRFWAEARPVKGDRSTTQP